MFCAFTSNILDAPQSWECKCSPLVEFCISVFTLMPHTPYKQTLKMGWDAIALYI